MSGASRRPRLREGSPITDPAYSRVAGSWSAVEIRDCSNDRRPCCGRSSRTGLNSAVWLECAAGLDEPAFKQGPRVVPDLLLERGIGIKIVMGLGVGLR